MTMSIVWRNAATSILLVAAGALSAAADEWPHWRGPLQSGVSPVPDMVDSFADENVIWRGEFSGRSTPIVMSGHVYVIGRVGEGLTKQERVACFDADNGQLLWDHRFNVFHTTIPYNRVGWANLAGDPATGNVYAHGVQGMLYAFSSAGDILWSRSLTEEFGRISGYGGRTHTPFVEGDLVIVSFLNLGWGKQTIPRHRYFAFDKNNGELVWVATPGKRPLDTTYSTPVVATLNGKRLLVAGNADGGVYAMEVATGLPQWGFNLSKRGINSSVVIDGDRVYAAHSEENLDNTVMGRVVCYDATGSGDVTATHELWRADGLQAGYTSPVIHANRLYVVDNSANLHALEAATGARLWQTSIGTVGKGSPVWADGKIFATEVNGRVSVVSAGAGEGELIQTSTFQTGGRPAEIFGSVAVAYERIYLATEDGLYCVGDAEREFSLGQKIVPLFEAAPETGTALSSIQVVPAETLAAPGDSVALQVRGFDALGRDMGIVSATYSFDGLLGELDGGWAKLASSSGGAAGRVRAQVGDLSATARIRVVPNLPWEEDFEAVSVGTNPSHWIGAGSKFKVVELEGGRSLLKPPALRGLHRSNVYLGSPELGGYTIQADMKGSVNKRNRPDMGLIAQRYTLDLMGNHQRLQVRSWAADLRMAQTVDFAWEPDVWYTMKMKVDLVDDEAIVRGKVWQRGGDEPKAWSIEARDPVPNRNGSPGLYGHSSADIYYDNVKVW
jgi:outer membrane protein assembly factor BamB